MKAVGFFFAVFVSMLAVFLVATGEVRRWFSPHEDPLILVSMSRSTKSETGKNMLDFDFWDAQQGRRKFTIRAELSQDALQGTSRIDDIQEISLKDGIIEIPVYRQTEPEVAPQDATQNKDEKQVHELLLNFESAVYRRSGGLARGKGRLEVVLRDGSGKGNDGSDFFFKELLFSNDPDSGDRGRFRVRSSKPVSLDNSYLSVESPSGLEGVLSDRGGFEYVVLLPPVYTYLKPNADNLFALKSKKPGKRASGEGNRGAESEERVAITGQGPLELFLREIIRKEETEKQEETAEETRFKRISFSKDVLIYQIDTCTKDRTPPPPEKSWFHCQKLELEVIDSPKGPLPRRAVATWPGGRVQAHIAQKDKTYVLDGERLEWVRREPSRPEPPPPDSATTPHVAAPDTDLTSEDEIVSEALLTGKPTLRGENVNLKAERAKLMPAEGRVVLETVSGNIVVHSQEEQPPDGKQKPSERLFGAMERSKNEKTPDSWPHAIEPSRATTARTRTVKERLTRVLDFRADQTDMFFQTSEDGKSQELSHFVALGNDPRGVVIQSRSLPSIAGDKKQAGAADGELQARGKTLKYTEKDKLVTVEGTSQVPPHLSRGESWVEARKIHLLLEEGVAWFENQVTAHMEGQEGKPKSRDAGNTADRQAFSGPVQLDADLLVLGFPDGKTLQRARARGTPTAPVRLTTLEEPKCRLFAPEMNLDAEQRIVKLLGADERPGPVQLARMDLEDTEVHAGRILFEQEAWKCHLRDRVRIKLYSRQGESHTSQFEVLASKADVEFFEGFQGFSRDSGGGLATALRSFKSFSASAGENNPLEVRGKNFLMRGEEATWEFEKQELRFFGRGMQQIELTHAELSGPVRAREIIYEPERQLLILRGSVSGFLRQEGHRQSAKSGPPSKTDRRSLVWEFETSTLELELNDPTDDSPRAAAGSLQLGKLRARDKVVLWNAMDGIRLRGDDLAYDHATQTVRVFSSDGRPQTLTHFKEPKATRLLPGPVEVEPLESAKNVDKILAQEIWVRFYESDRNGSQQEAERVILVQFRKDVIASFVMSGDTLEDFGSGKTDIWKLHSDTLTLHLNPAADPNSPQIIPWAMAKGDVVCTAGSVRATGERAEYMEATRKLTLSGTGIAQASVLDTSNNRSESALCFVVQRRGEKVVWNHLSRFPLRKVPWPGIPENFGPTP